jgi:predicted dehydrogenase
MTSLCIVYAGWDPNWLKALLGVMLLLALVSKGAASPPSQRAPASRMGDDLGPRVITQYALEVGKRYGAATAPDVDAAMDDPNVDAVVIASATPTHVDLLTRAVRAGKAVLCEKPIDLDLARLDRCWVEIAALNPIVMVGFNRRFDPSFREVHDRIVAGDIGRLEQLIIVSRDPAPAPREYLAVSGGLFRDMTIHDFDLARFFLDEVVEVYATGANVVADYIAELGDIDSAVVLLRRADGALCHITNSRHSVFGYDQRLEAFGRGRSARSHRRRPRRQHGVAHRGGRRGPIISVRSGRAVRTCCGSEFG